MNPPYPPAPGYPPQPGYPPRPPRQGMGCLAVGCICVAIGLILLAVGVGGFGWYAYSNVRPFVGTHQVPIRVDPANPAEYSALVDRFNTFLGSLQTGQAATLRLSAKDLNTAIAMAPDAESMRGKAHVDIVGNTLLVESSFPLPTDDTKPSSGQSYYLNGKLHFAVTFAGGEFTFLVRKLETLEGKEAPSLVMALIRSPDFSRGLNQGFNKNFRDGINKNPAASAMLDKIQSVTIQGNQIVITSGEGQPVPTP